MDIYNLGAWHTMILDAKLKIMQFLSSNVCLVVVHNFSQISSSNFNKIQNVHYKNTMETNKKWLLIHSQLLLPGKNEYFFVILNSNHNVMMCNDVVKL